MNFKLKKYKGFEIHYTNGYYKYDIYDTKYGWCMSMNTLREVKEYINALIFTRRNIPG